MRSFWPDWAQPRNNFSVMIFLSLGCGLSIMSHVAGSGSDRHDGCGDSRPLQCPDVESTPAIQISERVLMLTVPNRVRAISGVRASSPDAIRPRWPDHALIARCGRGGLCSLSAVADSLSKRRDIRSRPHSCRFLGE
jgi:hypothetical protein